jgi:hypothetical protein
METNILCPRHGVKMYAVCPRSLESWNSVQMSQVLRPILGEGRGFSPTAGHPAERGFSP